MTGPDNKPRLLDTAGNPPGYVLEANSRACQACKRKVTFARNEQTGAIVPFERLPTWTLTIGVGHELMAYRLPAPAWVNHFLTCSDPNRFGRRADSANKPDPRGRGQ